MAWASKACTGDMGLFLVQVSAYGMEAISCLGQILARVSLQDETHGK